MKDIVKLKTLLDKMGTPYTEWGDKYVCDQAILDGAIQDVSICGAAHLSFDKHGMYVGASTDSINSYIRKKQ